MSADQFKGKWEIIKTSMWEKDDLDLVQTAYISFDDDSGKFHFICVDGILDVEYNDNKAEFSWEGNDEGEMASGRGWATINEDEMHGKIYFYQSDNSTFVATKMNNS